MKNNETKHRFAVLGGDRRQVVVAEMLSERGHDVRIFGLGSSGFECKGAQVCSDAGVLIHEGRFVYERRNLELVADLGKLWESETSLPLQLGAIVAKRELGEEVIAKFEQLLGESVRYAFDHPLLSRGFVKEHAQELEDEVIDKHIALFVNDYTISLGDEGCKAVERLLGV